VRRSTAETPFGTIKAGMGATLDGLHVLDYNIKRVIAILGVQGLLRAI
jgi:transposase